MSCGGVSVSGPRRLAHICWGKSREGDIWKGSIAGDPLLVLGGAGENKMCGGEGIREAQQEGTAACAACPPADRAWHMRKIREIRARNGGEVHVFLSFPPQPPLDI